MQTTIDNLNKNLAAEKKTSAETKAKVCWDGLATFFELCSLFYVILWQDFVTFQMEGLQSRISGLLKSQEGLSGRLDEVTKAVDDLTTVASHYQVCSIGL